MSNSKIFVATFISLKNIRTPYRWATGNPTQVSVRKLGRLKADALSPGANLVINKYPDRAAYRATPLPVIVASIRLITI